MRVLFVVREFDPQAAGGVSYHVDHLSESFNELEHEVYILCDQTSSDIEYSKKLEYISGIYSVKCQDKLIQPMFNLKGNQKIPDIIDREGIDLVQYHAIGNWNHKSSQEVFKIYKSHMAFVFSMSLLSQRLKEEDRLSIKPHVLSIYSKTIERYLEQKSFENSDFQIYNSNLTMKKVAETIPTIDQSSATVIPNGVDFSEFTVKDDVDHSNPGSSSYLLFAGGDSRRKGIVPLLEAWRAYNGEIDELKIVGTFNDFEEKKRVSAIDDIDLIGFVSRDRLKDLYRDAAALIHPAFFEPFGNVIFESLACGTPVIISNENHIGATPYVNDNVRETVDPRIPDSITEAIYSIENSAQYPDAHDTRHSIRQYSWESVAQETINSIPINTHTTW